MHVPAKERTPRRRRRLPFPRPLHRMACGSQRTARPRRPRAQPPIASDRTSDETECGGFESTMRTVGQGSERHRLEECRKVETGFAPKPLIKAIPALARPLCLERILQVKGGQDSLATGSPELREWGERPLGQRRLMASPTARVELHRTRAHRPPRRVCGHPSRRGS